jgi:hypothetical protein
MTQSKLSRNGKNLNSGRCMNMRRKLVVRLKRSKNKQRKPMLRRIAQQQQRKLSILLRRSAKKPPHERQK